MSKPTAIALALGLSLGHAFAQGVLPPVIPPSSNTNLLPLNNTWLGTNTFQGVVTFNAGTIFNGTSNTFNQNANWTGPIGGLAGQGAPINLYTSPPPNFTGISGYVQPWSFSPTTGALTGDVTRTANIINFTTLASPAFFETGLVVNSTLSTGFVNSWVASTAYVAGDYIFGVGLNIYRTTSNCTTASSEPSGTSPPVDGTCAWVYISADLFYGKAGAAFFTEVKGANAPAGSWGLYEDFTLDATAPYGHFWAAHEIAVTNAAHAASVGTDAYYGLLIDGFVTHPGLAAFALTPQTSGPTYAWHYGMLFQNWGASDQTILDQSNSNISYDSTGSHPGGTIVDSSTSGAFLHSSGTYADAVWLDTSTSGIGIALTGTYSSYEILGNTWSIVSGGLAHFVTLQLTGIPTSAGSGGLYVCADSTGNTYKKSSCP